MDSIELNKIMAAFLIAGIVLGLGGVLGSQLIRSGHPARLAFIVVSALPEGVSAPLKRLPIAELLARADPARGASDAGRLCGSCHSFAKGGPIRVGPNLYGILGTPVAEGRGYDFSAALRARHGIWDFEALDGWLANPGSYAPGTRMAFAGISRDRQRADVIDYLRMLADHPEPLPREAPQAARSNSASASGGR